MNSSDPKFRHMLRNAAILIGAFLLGLLPPLVRTMQLKKELAVVESRSQLADVREMAALGYLEVSRNNFGLAARHASTLFDQLNTIAGSAEEPLRSVAAEELQKRDSIMGKLAAADPGARNELQDLTSRLLADPSVTVSRAQPR